jgi:hypothetical protein
MSSLSLLPSAVTGTVVVGRLPVEPQETMIGRRIRDPEERPVVENELDATREKMFDKTVADSLRASDPPSSIPDPEPACF